MTVKENDSAHADSAPRLTKRACPFEFTKELTDDGSFEGYGSVFEVVDYYNEVVVAGAFAESLQRHAGGGQTIKMLWQHDSSKPIGVWPSLAEDAKGLKVQGKLFLDVQQGREAYVLMKGDAKSGLKGLDGLSIGYALLAHEVDGKIWRLTKIDLGEISPVTFPACVPASIDRVKSVESIRDFEAILRDAGFSKRDAKAVASGGYRALTRRDVGVEELDQLATALGSLIKSF
jgi:HK97 family phage prohead protease